MDVKATLNELSALLEAEKGPIVEASKTIWANPELAFKEFKASSLLAGLLKKFGFEVEYPYAGMETAFRAEYSRGQGGATFALAAEYDALAGIGHACGHNLIGAASVAAACAAKAYMDKHDITGTIVVLGTPGEEGGGGKVLMLKNADCLKGVDAVMMSHAAADSTRGDSGSSGIRRYEVVFHGLAAHAAGSPEKGINALDAQILLFNAIGLYRQQMNRDASIHGVILEGGEAANVIPDCTRSRIYLRSKQEKIIDELYERFAKMVEGAALMTGCTSEIEQYSIPYKSRKPNRTLSNLFLDAARAMGTMNPTDALLAGRGSSDFGDFSHAAPGAHTAFAIAPPGTSVPGHSEAKKANSNTEFAYARMIDTGAILAYCALRVLTDAELRKTIRAEFEG
ncbi:MAG: M20 family metallopeptidase [Lentisphaeria bacterium]|jgi:amidohydrolase|nr:M20 family metallopeptidase [Lentisphaeria bacterium]